MEVAKLPNDFIPTDLHWLLLSGRNSGGGKGSDTLLICSNDGRFIILNKSARVERNISAHSAAIRIGRWSPDGAGLLTGKHCILSLTHNFDNNAFLPDFSNRTQICSWRGWRYQDMVALWHAALHCNTER